MQSLTDCRTDGPFASILIPTYRRPNLVCRAIEGCLQQSADVPEPIEIVIIDNCPDRSAEEAIKKRFGNEPSTVRYVHEPRTGFSFVRNCALRNSRGRFVIFLDDDQFPQAGWLSAFVKAGKAGAKAAFGPLAPKYDIQPTNYARILDRIFSRQFARNGDDISKFYPYLSTGNCMFDKAECFPNDPAFDIRFNKIGGEDVWMFKGLYSRNIAFTWVAGALALESVPPERMTQHWLAKRRYRSGQIRALLALHPAQWRPYAAVFWMGAGAIQAVTYGTLYLLASIFRRSDAGDFIIKAAGGAGKVFWFRVMTNRT